ncbi:hypothetical protein SCLCIDRAFT_1179634 [Scleroderma citrinum Foug A]|uniref:Zn(2)-C6 fungal-type domain-containing protein n=1 Tax=Scleroderma citrinum Foug A TaxID=1036808 RepID=A0A0C3E0K3_9AGAM|nr:hypothetical protein SCLCIDRAFT_1179634 [Scleroderma citrinum Foug A]
MVSLVPSPHLSESPDETGSIHEANEDGQLTIRIPNPKVYMARQSQWKGRRGKPRCDHCRINNLKCDRVLPTCNHCSWANNRECGYTPLPTPAHRGIPRCDRCRFGNLKCDRNLPVCSHCADGGHSECNYTPKKRHKVPSDHAAFVENLTSPYGAKTTSFLVSETPTNDEVPGAHGDSGDGHSFYGQNVAALSGSRSSSTLSPTERNRKEEIGSHSSDHFAPDHSEQRWLLRNPLPSLTPRQSHSTSQISFISQPPLLEKGPVVARSLIQSWVHPSFAPLPDAISKRISSVSAVEMPSRALFEEALAQFLADLPIDLRETCAFSPEVYAVACHSLSGVGAEKLSDRLRMWLAYHHVRLGSEKYHLLLLPRDAFFQIVAAEEENLCRDYMAYVDDHPTGSGQVAEIAASETIDHDLGGFEWTRAFERIPVLDQIYDILVYAHRAHGPSSSVLFEAQRIGMAGITWPMVEIFIKLCPLCNLRSKSNSPRNDTAAK